MRTIILLYVYALNQDVEKSIVSALSEVLNVENIVNANDARMEKEKSKLSNIQLENKGGVIEYFLYFNLFFS